MAKILEFKKAKVLELKGTKIPAADDSPEARLERIKTSLSKINSLMAELKDQRSSLGIKDD